jgi:NADPH-dependent glutamate synthase beta subunit-like oxidoreductase
VRDGRRKPNPIPGSEHALTADLVVEAMGQRVDVEIERALTGLRFDEHGLLWTNRETLETSRPGVFAAGDIVNGGSTVVQAVAEGARAAREMDKWLCG